MSAEPKVKGLAFRSVLRATVTLRGEPVVERAYGAMKSEVADALRYGRVIASGWYPIAWYREMFRGIAAASGEGHELAKKIGAEAIREDMTGVHKVVLRLLSPQTVISQAQKIFSKYYDTGHVEVLESRQGYHHAVFRGCTGFDRNMWSEIIGASEQLLELAGARHVRMRVLSGAADFDDSMDLEARWT